MIYGIGFLLRRELYKHYNDSFIMPKCVSCGKYTKYHNRKCYPCHSKSKRTTSTTRSSKYPRGKKTSKKHEIRHIDGNVNDWRKDNVVRLPRGLHKKLTKEGKGMAPDERRKNSGRLLRKLGKKIWKK